MAATSFIKAGINARVYRNTGTYGSPVWAAIDMVRGASPSFAWDMVDASIRGTPAKLYGKGQVDLMVSLDVRADDLDAGYQALWDAAMDQDTVMDLLILNGLVTVEGSLGVRSEFLVNLAGDSQGAGDLIYTTFELKPSWTTAGRYPLKAEIGAGPALSTTAF